MKHRSLYFSLVLGAAIAAIPPRLGFAQCPHIADGCALFLCGAPPAPAGWEMNDDPS
jgi:hypothetical protein